MFNCYNFSLQKLQNYLQRQAARFLRGRSGCHMAAQTPTKHCLKWAGICRYTIQELLFVSKFYTDTYQYNVWLRTGQPGDRGSIPGRGKSIFSLNSVSGPDLGPTQPPVQWVPGVLSSEV
jgi:hypothetical protein